VIREGDYFFAVAAAGEAKELLRIFGRKTEPARRVVIMGGGNTGRMLAGALEGKGLAVKIIEERKDRCRFLSERLNRTIVLHGDGTSQDLLLEENIRDMDIFLAVTDDDHRRRRHGHPARGSRHHLHLPVIHPAGGEDPHGEAGILRMNLKNIFHILGIFVFLIGAAMLPAFVIAAALHEAAWRAIGLASLVTMGAGLGPASAFLYSGPAINVMAIFLSARVLGFDIGVARAIAAIVFAGVIGLLMAVIFKKSEHARTKAAAALPPAPHPSRRLWKNVLFFVCLVMFLVFSDWYNTNDVTIALHDGTTMKANVEFSTQDFIEVKPYAADGKMAIDRVRLSRTDIAAITPEDNFVMRVNAKKWYLAGLMAFAVLLMLWRWFTREEVKDWLKATWDFGLMIVPLLFGGVFVTGFVGAILPEKAVAAFVGGNGLISNLVASVIGALWYFATLTEIPITQMLMRLGMGKGPALALLLAGPALSLPSILVINKVIGPLKTFVFCLLTVMLSAMVGYLFGICVP